MNAGAQAGRQAAISGQSARWGPNDRTSKTQEPRFTASVNVPTGDHQDLILLLVGWPTASAVGESNR